MLPDKWEKFTAGYKEVRESIRDKENYLFYNELDPLLSGKAQRRETLIRTQLRRQCQGIELPREIEMEIRGGEDEFIRSDGEDTEEDTNEFPGKKQQRSLNFRNDEMIKAFKDLFDSFLARQSRFFVVLLESMEWREKIREKIRLEREEKWREEDRQHRLMFQNAMTLFMKKIVHEGVRCTSDSAPCHHVNLPASTPIAETAVTTAGGGGGSGGGSAARKRSKNWKRAEVLLLIKVRTEM
uniref:Uncharacterized protein n=1 Tax=Nelumbo nucifera TaxID=4432 RepID=A0A822ZIF9_NELNU|nr:TPA_asm: hypothetical protein HUJ06_002569 [Nelumbo nucifera]